MDAWRALQAVGVNTSPSMTDLWLILGPGPHSINSRHWAGRATDQPHSGVAAPYTTALEVGQQGAKET